MRMVTYAVVNYEEKVNFEKTYQIPYGYNNIPLHGSFGLAMKWFNDNLGPRERKYFVIEKLEGGKREIVFKLRGQYV
jgi:hypothetical protein